MAQKYNKLKGARLTLKGAARKGSTREETFQALRKEKTMKGAVKLGISSTVEISVLYQRAIFSSSSQRDTT